MFKDFSSFYPLLALYQKIEGQEAHNVAKELFNSPIITHKEENVFKISNPRMRGKTLVIGEAPFVFDAEGIANVSGRYIREAKILLQKNGYSLLEDKTIGKQLVQQISGELQRREVGEKIEEKIVSEEVDKYIKQGQRDLSSKSSKSKVKKHIKFTETVDLDSMIEDVSPKYPAEEKGGIVEPPKKKRGRPRKNP